MRISATRHRRFQGTLATVEAASENAIKQLKAIFSEFVGVQEEPLPADQREEARFNGWLDAIQAVGNSEVLASHPELRAALLDELEAFGVSLRPESPQSLDAVDPSGESEGTPSTRV